MRRHIKIEGMETVKGGSLDGVTKGVTQIMIPDGKLFGPFEFMRPLLEERLQEKLGKERIKAAVRKEQLETKLNITEFSKTYFEPTLLELDLYEFGANTKAYVIVKPRGMPRPDAIYLTSIINTKRLYIHESGILGSLENYSSLSFQLLNVLAKYHESVRLPVRIMRELGLENIRDSYKDFDISLDLPEMREGNYCDGDVCYKRQFMLDSEKDPKVIGEQMKEVTKLITSIGEKIKNHKRKNYYLNLFGQFQDVKNYLSFIESTTSDLDFNILPYPVVVNQKGILGRLFSLISNTGYGQQNIEVRFPLSMVHQMRNDGVKTGVQILDDYIHYTRPLEIVEDKKDKYSEYVHMRGDFIHSKRTKRDGYEAMKDRIDSLGKKWLDIRWDNIQTPFYLDRYIDF